MPNIAQDFSDMPPAHICEPCVEFIDEGRTIQCAVRIWRRSNIAMIMVTDFEAVTTPVHLSTATQRSHKLWKTIYKKYRIPPYPECVIFHFLHELPNEHHEDHQYLYVTPEITILISTITANKARDIIKIALPVAQLELGLE